MYLMPYFSKRLNFFLGFSCLIAVRYLISFAFAILYLHCFFNSGWYTASLLGIVLDGVFIECSDHVTHNLLVTQNLDLQSLIEVGWRTVFQNPVNTCGFFLDRVRQ